VGLDVNGCRFLLVARRFGVDFSDVLTLGHQGLHLRPEELRHVLIELGFPADRAEVARMVAEHGGFAEGFLRILGAQRVTALDGSPYEGAALVHDLNEPVPEHLHDRFTVVLDGGTLEHVFDFPTAIRSCMEMVKLGGHFLAITPTNNFMGHGFYQFSPELFFRVFDEANGFSVEHLFAFDVWREEWYAVRDPRVVGRRVGAACHAPTYLLVMARKDRRVPLLRVAPIQNDYEASWKDEPRPVSAFRAPPGRLRRRSPRVLRLQVKRWLDQLNPLSPRYDPAMFERVRQPWSAGGPLDCRGEQ
jgi:SAM-dependent methyltransferase